MKVDLMDIAGLARSGLALDRVGYKPLSPDRWGAASYAAHIFAMWIMAIEA